MALKSFPPSSLKQHTLQMFEFLKYDSKEFRSDSVIDKTELFAAYLKKIQQKEKKTNIRELEAAFNDFAKILDKILFVKISDNELSEIKWKRIDDFCSLMRLAERSEERKVRWALYNVFTSNKKSIPIASVESLLSDFKINNLDKIIKKILKAEQKAGLDAKYDGKNLVINSAIDDKLVSHYLADAIEEQSRRSPGEMEEQILDLLDEGSYSNQEIAKALRADEALISRTIHKLRDQNKIVLSSFGNRGARYFTTNCDNCPFGTTKDSCRKEALSYIISAFNEDYGIELTANDFDDVETNQALLRMQRITMIAQKEKDTKLERNLSTNIAKLLGRVVENSLNIKKPNKKSPLSIPQIKLKMESQMTKLPLLYQLGLLEGAKQGVDLMDDILKLATKSIKKEDRLKVKKHSLEETNKFLKTMGLKESSLE